MTDQELQLTVTQALAALKQAEADALAATKAKRVALLKKVGHYALAHAVVIGAAVGGFVVRGFMGF